MDANRFDSSAPTAWRLALVLALALPPCAVAPRALAGEGQAAVPAHEAQPAWLQPIVVEQPIRRMSVLKSEYRRIRQLRRAQVQPEYERRVEADGEAAADAWREATLREVARRDLRALRERLER